MRIFCESIGHFINWIESGRYFAQVGYSDAEWYSILATPGKVGGRTGLGQVIDKNHGDLLFDVVKRRHRDPWFLFAVPKVLWTLPGFAEGQIDWFLGRHDIDLWGYERDMITDDMACGAEMYPFIQVLRQRKTVMIGPEPLRCMVEHLKLDHFVPIETPNLHLKPGGIDRAVEGALAYGKPAIYLVSAGVSAAVIIDRLYDRIGKSWFFDCGSIWDAFAGIGGQRQWRADLYADPAKLKMWRRKNLTGK